MAALLAFDTAGERIAVAAGRDGQVFEAHDDGGAKASATVLPAIGRVLAAAGLALADLDAIAFGRGPGAFTGLRTACAVAQGLAFGAGKPVLPIDTLLAVAETARRSAAAAVAGAPFRVWGVVDARMNEVYAAEYLYAESHDGERWLTCVEPMLADAATLSARWAIEPPRAVAGDALTAFAGRLETGTALTYPDARPTGAALLALAEQAWRDGAAVDAALALPLYVRDKVAQTTTERDAARAAAAVPAPGRVASRAAT